jgi:hypothetical protein
MLIYSHRISRGPSSETVVDRIAAVTDTPIHAIQFSILMTTFWTWASIIGLSMTPNLVLGPSVAVGVGIAANFDPLVLVPVVAAAGYAEGLIVAWLAGESTQIGIIDRWVTRMRTPRSVDLASRWGVWGGLTFGCAAVGQEPILVALRWLGVEMRQIWFPLAVSNAVFAAIYYAVVSVGLNQIAGF